MQTKLRKIGNSCGILLPAAMLRELGMREGDKVDLSKDADRLVVRSHRRDRISFAKALEECMDENADILAELAER